ncbi:MAG TPA: TrkH family potassium uptake protein [Planctomycetota bacterium]|nr:TrkH family potassium uptake protein [Planctomycetota bacterium]
MLLLIFAAVMGVPLLVAIFYEGPAARAAGAVISQAAWHQEIRAFSIAIGVSAAAGFVLRVLSRGARAKEITVREGFAVVGIAWAALAAVGALPFYFSGQPGFETYTNCYFESISGLTTTGSSILANIEILPNGLLFWRSFTHWIGGMGIVVLAVAIFPALGIGGYQLYRAEVSGTTKEKLTPRITETAKILWGVYVLFTIVLTLLLLPKMSLFDALCQTFGCLATGGFSTKNLSIAAFNSVYVDVVIMVFTFLAGINFTLHYQALRGNLRSLLQDSQTRFFTGSVLLAIVLVTVSTWLTTPMPKEGRPVTEAVRAEQAKVATLPGALHRSAFEVVTTHSACGFVTADYDLWPNFCRVLLVLLMFMGGCAGSTSGGLKSIRILLLLKMARREIDKMIRPRAVLPVKLAGQAVDESVLQNVGALFILWLMIFAVATIVMTWFVPNIETALSAVACTMGGVGPGLAGVGPMQNFNGVATPGKWILSACMLLGRLEIYSIIMLMFRKTWRR